MRHPGGTVVELEQDMLTIKGKPKVIFPKEGLGSFRQAEVTSCGLNGGPLKGAERYEARIACNLWSKDGVVAGFKYFQMDGEKTLSVDLRGTGSGSVDKSVSTVSECKFFPKNY